MAEHSWGNADCLPEEDHHIFPGPGQPCSCGAISAHKGDLPPNVSIAHALELDLVDYGESCFYFKAPAGYCGPSCEDHEHLLPDFVAVCRQLAGLEPPADKFESYEELRTYLENLPMTWYPDLIRAMVASAYSKKVFVPGGASKFIATSCEK